MAYPAHFLFVMGGTLGGGGAEIWECTIRGGYVPAASGTPAKYLNDISGDLISWFTAPSSLMRNDAALTFCKFNAIGPNGHYVNPNAPVSLNLGSHPGPTAALTPEFTSIATSWRTASPSRYALNGRIYPPNTLTSAPGQARISNADRAAVAAAGVALIVLLRNGSNENDGGIFRAQVVSEHGEAYPVTSVRVGDVLDVQRRRKNALREQYITDAVPAP